MLYNYEDTNFQADAGNTVESRFGANFGTVFQYFRFAGFAGFVGSIRPYLNPFGSNRMPARYG